MPTYLIVSVCLWVCFCSTFLIQQIESVLQYQVMCFLLIFGCTIASWPYERYGKVSDHTKGYLAEVPTLGEGILCSRSGIFRLISNIFEEVSHSTVLPQQTSKPATGRNIPVISLLVYPVLGPFDLLNFTNLVFFLHTFIVYSMSFSYESLVPNYLPLCVLLSCC